jgi:hypothetical protein
LKFQELLKIVNELSRGCTRVWIAGHHLLAKSRAATALCTRAAQRYTLAAVFSSHDEREEPMKRLVLILAAALLASGCSMLRQPWSGVHQEAHAEQAKAAAKLPPGSVSIHDQDGTAVVQKVEFRSGVSSATVERLGQRFGCTGTSGAGLVTEKGPVEVYRMQCDNGTTFMAQCELRQCRPMR